MFYSPFPQAVLSNFLRRGHVTFGATLGALFVLSSLPLWAQNPTGVPVFPTPAVRLTPLRVEGEGKWSVKVRDNVGRGTRLQTSQGTFEVVRLGADSGLAVVSLSLPTALAGRVLRISSQDGGVLIASAVRGPVLDIALGAFAGLTFSFVPPARSGVYRVKIELGRHARILSLRVPDTTPTRPDSEALLTMGGADGPDDDQ